MTLKRAGQVIDTFTLDMKANGGITGSKLSNPMEDEMEPEEQLIRKEDFKVISNDRLHVEIVFLYLS